MELHNLNPIPPTGEADNDSLRILRTINKKDSILGSESPENHHFCRDGKTIDKDLSEDISPGVGSSKR